MDVEFDKCWTCYEGKEEACGICASCSSRIQGFLMARIKDPQSYSIKIPWQE